MTMDPKCLLLVDGNLEFQKTRPTRGGGAVSLPGTALNALTRKTSCNPMTLVLFIC